ncbi:rhomboid family protein [Nitzschia inconspicua]|uniref:Rhomboid family protein n=1 Tax=Nitzschia inconspicua TaxID=303405 RepID=A0A9K3L0Y6_9STRA|nr:rhomboid family protein [Nitzschia inconspicua]
MNQRRRQIRCSVQAVVMALAVFLSVGVVPSRGAAQGYLIQPLMSPMMGRRGYRSRGYRRPRRTSTRMLTHEELQSHFLDDENWMTDPNVRPWDGNLRAARRPNQYSWTTKLVFANILGYGLQVFNHRITELGVKLSDKILNGQELYRLLTPVFLHGSPIHLFMNLVSLRNIGPMTEQFFGSGRFLAMYLVSGMAGNLVSSFQTPNPALGASGAVFGVMGALYVFLNRNDWLMGEQGEMVSSAITQSLIINVAIGFMNPMVDNWGHLGGALGGALMSYYFGPRLYLAEWPNDGGRVIVDKPVMRLPPTLENIPSSMSKSFSRMARRMQIWRVKDGLQGKPWNPKQKRRADYQRRIYNVPNRSIKPKLDD